MDKYMKCKIFAMTFIMAICFVAGLLFKDWLNDGAAPESALAIAALIITFAIFFWKCEIDGENSRYDDTGHLSMGIFSTSDKNPLLDKKENFVTDTKVSFSTPDPIEDGLFDGKMSHKVVFLGSEGLSYTAEYLKNLEKNLKNDLPEQNIYVIETKGLTDVYKDKCCNVVYSPFIDLPNLTGLHIYIVSDDEINENDWHINKTMNEADRASRNLSINHKSDGEFGASIRKQYKKIILTSNINLVSDGVEALDNNFYSWFAKNPDRKHIKIIPKNVVCTNEEKSHGITEYAVGDYVSGLYTTGKIKEIKGDFCVIEHDSHTERISLDHIKPIPISEKWLLELGYESNAYQDRYELREKGIHVECDKTSGITKLWIFGHPEIKYVHQLQNIDSLIKDKISN